VQIEWKTVTRFQLRVFLSGDHNGKTIVGQLFSDCFFQTT